VTTAWQVAFVALSGCVIVLSILLVTTMRQVGVISLSLRPTEQGRGPLLNAPAPALAGIDALSGHRWSLKAHASTARVIVFLSSQCESCRTLVPALNAFAEERTDLAVVAVVPGNREDARRFAELTGLAVSTICDHDSQAFALYNVSFTPHAVSIDAGGRITVTTAVKDRTELDQLVPVPGYSRPNVNDHPNAAPPALALKET
jgi:thiol-disulfide isomerase/thioredoxin